VARDDLTHLTEGQRLFSVDLTRAEAADLNRSGLVTAQPDTDGWRVTAEHAVGSVRRGDLVVRVAPKIGAAQVLTLLARAHGVHGLKVDPEVVDVAADAELSAVLATLFAREASGAMAAGPLRGYRTEDQSLPVLRGRLRLREQHLRRFGALVPLEVTVDEWTLDTDDNRRLRAATRALMRLPGVPAGAAQYLQHLDGLLAEVTLPAPGAPIGPWTATRLNARLHRLLHLADLVLSHLSVESRSGTTATHGFVVNMAWLFETLVARLLSERSPGWSAQETLVLDAAKLLTIQPDLLLRGNDGIIDAVADTKYKLLDGTGKVPNPDVYQLVTYAARLGLGTGHLIYASDGECLEPLDILGTGTRLLIHGLDLTRDISDVEDDVAAIHDRILSTSRDGVSRAILPA
jgi:5-methylcytosine-specific restriction enzyme subunit McrC